MTPDPSYEMYQTQLQYWVDVGRKNSIGGFAEVEARYPFPTEGASINWLDENGWKLRKDGRGYENDTLPDLFAKRRQVREFRFEKWIWEQSE